MNSDILSVSLHRIKDYREDLLSDRHNLDHWTISITFIPDGIYLILYSGSIIDECIKSIQSLLKRYNKTIKLLFSSECWADQTHCIQELNHFVDMIEQMQIPITIEKEIEKENSQ